MPDFASQQHAFAAALGSAAHAAAATPLFHGAPDAVLDRLAVYRGNVTANARKALANAYPIVVKIVGDDFFEALAREYLRRHPAASGDLNEYGSALADFTAGFPDTQDLPYLPDVARMEWLLHRAHYAADAAPLDLGGLKAALAQDAARLALRLAPACALLESRWPLARIWEVHQDGYDGAFTIDFDAGTDRILVHRPRYRAVVTALGAGAFRLLERTLANGTIAESLEAGLAAEPDFDLASALRTWVEAGVVVGVDGSNAGNGR